uniref:[histone H4]-lysine(20) N-methyltransferase n=1 Tax=Astyanax mexicanus TaxID=7994 RepID=A0A3B1KAJ6_ASTMX
WFPPLNELKVETWRDTRGCVTLAGVCYSSAPVSVCHLIPALPTANWPAHGCVNIFVLQDVLCNGHSTLRSFLSHSASRAAHHEEISVKIIQDGKSSRIFCTQAEAQRNSQRAEEQPRPLHCVQSYLPSPTQITPEVNSARPRCQRGAVCRKVKVKRPSQRVAENRNSQNRKVTDYYPIRRSSRKSKTELKCAEKQHIDELITKGIENGMMVKYIEGKGRGVFATENFQKGQYVVEYHGDLLLKTDAKKREAVYAQDPTTGCYMYYFQYLSKTYCVDATKETDRMGRLINHSKNGNCQTKLHDINGIPHLILVASRDIEEGEELLYDYGDRSKASIAAHPWLKH